MRFLMIVLFVTVLGFAATDGCTEISAINNSHNQTTATITLTLLNDWPQTCNVFGLDIYEEGSDFYVLGVDNNSSIIRFYDPATGAPTATSIPLSSGNDGCFGVAWNDGPDSGTYYTNDWTDDVLYFTENHGGDWTTISNPADNYARGMDFDGTYYWCTDNEPNGIWRFQPGGSQVHLSTPSVTAQPSGLTVFPYNGNLAIAISCYHLATIEFYQWDGSALTYLGPASYPAAIDRDSVYGLGYAATNGHIYMSYKDYYGGGLHHLVELAFDITSLQRSSWGSIKSSF